MLIEQTKSKLFQMKLHGMAEGHESQTRNSNCLSLSFEERFGLLVDHELSYREDRRLQQLLRFAKLKEKASVESLDYRSGRNLERSTIASLALCAWIDRACNVLITGPTGTGKTFLACALGHQVCLKGKTVQFHRLGLLLGDLEHAKTDGSFRKRLAQVNRCALLILDDFGLKACLSPSDCELLMELLEGRQNTGATVVTSQLPIDRWHEYLAAGHPTTADAIMDRLVANAVKIDLQGPSLRQNKTRILEG